MSDELATLVTLGDGSTIGRELRWSASTGSTNDDLKQLARTGVAEGLVLVTDEQTAGRGRRGRQWLAPPGSSVLLSVLLRPVWLAPADGFYLTMLAAVGAAEAISATTGLSSAIKWPNDLVYADRKLGGILVEAELREQRLQWAVIGLGINVNWDTAEQPAIAQRATSLRTASGQVVDRRQFVVALLQQLDHWYGRLRQGQQPALRAAWLERLSTLGRVVEAETPAGPLVGLAEGVDPTGGLLIRTTDGRSHTLHAGEVSVRPQPLAPAADC